MFRSRMLTSFALGLAVANAYAADIHLQAQGDLKWYCGVTHFHTLWSDADCAPEVAVRWYLDHNYDFISITDHNILATGEKWVPVEDKPKARLTPDRVAMLQQTFGKEWVELRTQDGRQEMRLKTLNELIDAFSEPGSFLLIPGEEVTSGKAVHVNAVNIKETIKEVDGETTQVVLHKTYDAIEAHIARYGLNTLVHINHPNFSGHITAEEIVSLGGERFFEVFNGHGDVRNWGSPERHIVATDRLWDIILSLRFSQGDTDKPMYGVATDDAHDWFGRGVGGSIPGRGWVMVLANELSADTLITAMKQGRFYATSGVILDEIHATADSYTVHVHAETGVTYTTRFIGTLKGADITARPVQDADGKPVRATHQYDEAVGKILLETTSNPAVYPITGDEMYVRAKVVSSKLKNDPFARGDHETAWTQPVRIP